MERGSTNKKRKESGRNKVEKYNKNSTVLGDQVNFPISVICIISQFLAARQLVQFAS